MEKDVKITKILNVYEGEFAANKKAAPMVKRHSDCFVHYVYGEVEYDFGDHSFVATPENFFYLAKNSSYEIKPRCRSKYICIDFNFENGETDRRSTVFHNRSVSLKNDFEKMFREWSIPSPWREAFVFAGVYNLYAEALKTEQKQYSKSHPRLDEITNLIFDNYSDPDFTVESISEKTNLSQMHVRRILRSALDISPVEYILHLRLEKAKAMLKSSDFSISEIALAVGITDPYYFSRLFKKKNGMTPMEYRKAQT